MSGKDPVTWDEFPKIIELIGTEVAAALKVERNRITQLEEKWKQVDSAEAAEDAHTAVLRAYRGVWKQRQYEAGVLITCKGSLWLSEVDTHMQPGSGPDWKLISKNGGPPQ